MEAKDTAMSSKRIFKIVREHAPTDYCQLSLDTGKLVAKAQAEISFKAGIREVVDFVEEHTHNIDDWTGWQEQKEEWGLVG